MVLACLASHDHFCLGKNGCGAPKRSEEACEKARERITEVVNAEGRVENEDT